MRIGLRLLFSITFFLVPTIIYGSCGCGASSNHRTSLLNQLTRSSYSGMIKTGTSCCPTSSSPLFAGLYGSSSSPVSACCDTSDIALNAGSINNAAVDTMCTITASGKYFLNADITINPSNNNVTYIRIAADNVNLNLNGFSIKQGNNATGTVAIKVNAGFENITIHNGSIFNIKGTAIQLNGAVNNPLRTVLVKDIAIYDCTLEGIFGSYVENSLISSMQVLGCSGSHAGALGAIGLRLNRVTRVFVCDSIFNNNKSSGNVLAAGIYMTDCAECTVSGCTSSNNWGAIAYGFCLTSTVTSNSPSVCNNFFNNSAEMNRNLSTTTNTAAYGFFINNSRFTVVSQSKACNQQTATSVNNTHGYGFYSSNGVNNLFDECYATGNQGNGASINAIGVGFALENGDRFGTINGSSSIANNVFSPAGGTGYGVKIGGAPGSGDAIQATVSNNVFSNNFGTRYYGYKDFANCSTTLLIGNTANGQGKSLGGSGGNIIDSGLNNYAFTYTGASSISANKVLKEFPNGDVTTADCCACRLNNLSIYEVCP